MALFGVVALCSGIGFAMLGPGDPPAFRAASLLSVWVFGGWTAAAYVLGGAGWGVLVSRVVGVRATEMAWGDRAAIGSCLGIAATLTVTHLSGWLGWLNPFVAWLWTGAGLALGAAALVRAMRSQAPATVRIDRWVLGLLALGAGGVGVMLAASAMPPGAQWDSEFGGYDSLSYHLRLPGEWLDAGRITPLEHNVYSYLPGYMEAAAVHMAHLSVTAPRDDAGLSGLVAGEGYGAFAPNMLAMLLAIVGAWVAARVAIACLARAGVTGAAAMRGGAAAGALVLLTPWVHVVGSMAYNETGVIALGGGALLASVVMGLPPARRGVIVAVLMGGACGCKPTAILFLAPACAVAMGGLTPPRRWTPMFACGALVGLAMLSPWLARNAMHGGNPVFPQGTALFGAAHWSEQQASTYRLGHTDGSVPIDRALMLVRPDPSTTPDTPTVGRWRGLTNPQWALTPWVGALCGLGVLVSRRARRIGTVLLAGIGCGLLAWLIATHLQSRFLIPLVPLFAAGFGVALGVSGGRVRPALHIGTIALVLSLTWSVSNFASQHSGRPNELLGLGVGAFTGALDLGETSDAIPAASINRDERVRGTVLLVGESAPLYFRAPIRYATVWDRNPLGDIVRDAPEEPDAWIRSLGERGIGWVYISFAELDRLTASGWQDPEVSRDRVAALVERLGEPYRVWPSSGSALYRVPTNPASEP